MNLLEGLWKVPLHVGDRGPPSEGRPKVFMGCALGLARSLASLGLRGVGDLVVGSARQGP